MDHVDPILLTSANWLKDNRRVALATVISTWGSSPRPVGSQLLVDEAGRFEGSVSGGCVEAAVVQEAQTVIRSGAPKLLEFGVSDNDAWDVGLACGGTIRIWVTGEVTLDLVNGLIRLQRDKQPVLLLTILDEGEQSLVADPVRDVGDPWLAEQCGDALSSDRSRYVEHDGKRCFLRVFSLPIRLLIVGAVHIAQALIPMAQVTGYQVTLIDPRRAFASTERFTDVELTHEWPDAALARLKPDRRTAIVTLTHDPKFDERALERALDSDAFYVGALGSRRTHAQRVERLRENGVTEDRLERIHAPVGLDIGAATPAEIAVSIIAEITAALRRPASSQ